MAFDPKQSEKRNYKTTYVFIALVTISFSCLLFSTRGFVINFGDIGASVFSGLRNGIYTVNSFFQRTFTSIHELADLQKEYKELLDRLERYEQLERDVADIRQENIHLKEQLGFSESLQFRHIPAQIIGKDPDNLYSALVINKGVKQGISRNMPVVAYQDGVEGLVGKVVQVGRSESLVMPLFDSSCFVSARLAQTLYEGIVSGQRDENKPLTMQYIKKRAKEEIQYGDLVITSGLGGVFPRGINIGRVSKILYQEYDTSLTIELEPIIDFSRLEYVFVLQPENTGNNNEE